MMEQPPCGRQAISWRASMTNISCAITPGVVHCIHRMHMALYEYWKPIYSLLVCLDAYEIQPLNDFLYVLKSSCSKAFCRHSLQNSRVMVAAIIFRIIYSLSWFVCLRLLRTCLVEVSAHSNSVRPDTRTDEILIERLEYSQVGSVKPVWFGYVCYNALRRRNQHISVRTKTGNGSYHNDIE